MTGPGTAGDTADIGDTGIGGAPPTGSSRGASGQPPGGALMPAPRASAPAVRVPPLLHDALTALDADLGERCLGWALSPQSPPAAPPGPAALPAAGGSAAPAGPQARRPRKERIYRRRLELLAEALDPVAFQVVLGWLSSAKRTSVATRRGYCDDLLTIWAPLARELGHDRFFLGCLTTAHLQLWRSRVTARTAQPLTPRSVARYVKTLSSLHAYAAEVLDPAPPNPVTEDVRPVIDEEDPSTATPILEETEVSAVFTAARPAGPLAPTGRGPAAGDAALRDLVLVTLLYMLAGRVSEICAADAADLRTTGARTTAERTVLRARRKGHQIRDLEVPPTVARLLHAYLDGRTTGPLLLDDAGRRLDRHDADRISTRLGHAAGVLDGADLTPHVWRASRITHLLDALEQQGGEERVQAGLHHVMIYANHKDPKTTLRYWIRRSKAAKNAQLARTGEQLLADLLPDWLRTAPGEHTTS
ncbi:site-specific integrase [Actinomadura sp. NAK00032]|uniref:tyrosine-type recombinase/integrase n=1 Tax=Actinomadura sp. NAK00032 TaxID=2742128 RepID=UPI001592A82D|nr:tyrosine-type recombinase/integrase [Actinomadura sp. NAK00032]QKW36273.1 site-specific integrase [Actinomadura sp. NAK00032]